MTKLTRPISYYFKDTPEQKAYIQALLKEPELQKRFKKLSEIPDFLRMFFDWTLDYPSDLLFNKHITEDILDLVLSELYEALGNIDWNIGEKEILEKTVFDVRDKLNLNNAQILHPLRVALAGRKNSPTWILLLSYLGKVESLNRIEYALIRKK